jgi:hypothetical protein
MTRSMSYGNRLRCETRAGPRRGPRDVGLEMPWIPGTDLGPGQIPHWMESFKCTSCVWGLLPSLPKKRFLWGPLDGGSDSLHGVTVLSLSVRDRQEGLSCIPHLPYPLEVLEGIVSKRFFTFLKFFRKDWGIWSGPRSVPGIRVFVGLDPWDQSWEQSLFRI